MIRWLPLTVRGCAPVDPHRLSGLNVKHESNCTYSAYKMALRKRRESNPHAAENAHCHVSPTAPNRRLRLHLPLSLRYSQVDASRDRRYSHFLSSCEGCLPAQQGQFSSLSRNRTGDLLNVLDSRTSLFSNRVSITVTTKPMGCSAN